MSSSADTAVTALLAQLASLRQEVYERSRHQHMLVGFQITSVAAVVGVVATERVSPLFLLVLVFTSSAFALFWLDHHKQIMRLGYHIGSRIEPGVNAAVGVRVLEWDSPAEWHKEPFVIRTLFRVAACFVFIVPSVAALAGGAIAGDVYEAGIGMMALWISALATAGAVGWVALFLLWRFEPQRW